MDWFRSHHGAPSDSKWLVIARKAKVSPALVVATFWTLLDHASQQEIRGDISSFDPESAAAFLGIEDEEMEAIMVAFEAKGLIENGRIANWDKRQPKREREDSSTERVQRHRANKQATQDNVTPCNASETQETPRLDKRREESSPPTPSEPEAPMTTEKVFSFQDPLPLHVQNFLKESCPDYYEEHLRLALVGRSPSGLASYALEVLRGWKRGGKNAPQAPLPKTQLSVAPPDLVRVPGLQDLRQRRAAALAAPVGGSDAPQ